MREGDLILEANGIVLHNRHHLNASAVIKSLSDNDVTFVIVRSKNALEEVAVKPLTQFPAEPFKDNPIERYRSFKNVREVTIVKGDRGWGIMIIEGRGEMGSGVYISDIQAGSCAEEAGLSRGDLILSVNGEDFVGVSYNTAAKVLKTAQGTVKLIVANPSLPSTSTPSSASIETASEDPVAASATTEDKPKIAPKPVIAPKPAGLSPSHKPSEVVQQQVKPPPPPPATPEVVKLSLIHI